MRKYHLIKLPSNCTDKPHIGGTSCSLQHSAHPGLVAEDTLIQNSRLGLQLGHQVLVGVLQDLRLLRRHLLLRDPLGASQPLLGLGGLGLLCSWHRGEGMRKLCNVCVLVTTPVLTRYPSSLPYIHVLCTSEKQLSLLTQVSRVHLKCQLIMK